jgi:nucleotide-binding universal stress UspA family protein
MIDPVTNMEERKMTNVLVGVDGSDGSRRAAAFARDMAHAFHAKLTLLHVIEPLPEGPLTAFDRPQSDYYAERMQKASTFLRELADELGVAEAEQVIEMGRPSDVICGEAAERDADLIVIGSHGHGPVARLMVGSVGGRVASLSDRSVTIVR